MVTTRSRAGDRPEETRGEGSGGSGVDPDTRPTPVTDEELADLRALAELGRREDEAADLRREIAARTAGVVRPRSDTSYQDPMPVKKRLWKLPKPDRYQGRDQKALDRFLRACEEAFLFEPTAFVLDAEKIQYARVHVGEDVAGPLETWEARTGPGATWVGLRTMLQDLLQPEELRISDKYGELLEARQKVGQTVNQFAAYLADIERHLEPQGPQHAKENFLHMLRPEIRAAVRQGRGCPGTRDELVAYASQVEAAMLEDPRRRGTATVPATFPARAATSAAPSARTSSSSRKVPRGRTSKTEVADVPLPVDPDRGEQPGRDPPGITCWNCQETGHTQRRCPNPRASGPKPAPKA